MCVQVCGLEVSTSYACACMYVHMYVGVCICVCMSMSKHVLGEETVQIEIVEGA